MLKKSIRIFQIILVSGFLLRLLFLFAGATFYYGENIYEGGDTFSYVDSFLNLWNHGEYTFDFLNQDAHFGRLPGYPFFFGFHYILFGEYAYQALAFTQLIFDTSSIYLIYKISKNLFGSKTALISAATYAFYPFVIVWTPQIMTETMACWFTLMILYQLSIKRDTNKHFYWASILIILGFYFRVYLAVFAIPLAIKLLIERRWQFMLYGKLLFVTIFIFSFWPLRNYVNHDRLILTKPATAGYERYSPDITGCRIWIQTWGTDVNKIIGEFIRDDFSSVPDHIMEISGGKEKLQFLIDKGTYCGGGFHFWMNNEHIPKNKNRCDKEIYDEFMEMTNKVKSEYPFEYYFKVPLSNIKKAFFKSGTANNTSSFVKLIFLIRTLFVILGFIGIILVLKKIDFLTFYFYPVFMYFFICVIIRQLEMRYLLQADVVLILFSSVTIYTIWDLLQERLNSRKSA